MSKVVSQVSINAPAYQVWEALLDSRRISQWAPNAAKLDSLVELSGGSSSPRYFHYDLYSTVKEQLTQLDAGRSYSYVVSNAGPIKSANSSFSLNDSGGATVLSHTVEFQMKYGPVGVIADSLVFRPQFRKQMEAGLAALKNFIEAQDEIATLPNDVHQLAA